MIGDAIAGAIRAHFLAANCYNLVDRKRFATHSELLNKTQ